MKSCYNFAIGLVLLGGGTSFASREPNYKAHSGSYRCVSQTPEIDHRRPTVRINADFGWIEVKPTDYITFAGAAPREWSGKRNQLNYYLQTRVSHLVVFRFHTGFSEAAPILLLPDSKTPFNCKKSSEHPR